MIDLQNLTFDEIQQIKNAIAVFENEKIRTYEISFRISFRTVRDDALINPGILSNHIITNILSHWDVELPERIDFISVKEI